MHFQGLCKDDCQNAGTGADIERIGDAVSLQDPVKGKKAMFASISIPIKFAGT